MKTLLAMPAFLLSISFVLANDIDVGLVDQKAPEKKELVAPKEDKDIAQVDLHETVKGKVAKDEKRKLYVIVCPLIKDVDPLTWWVQQEVDRKDEMFNADAQFGEEELGKGDYFAVITIATDKNFSVGDTLTAIPEKATCTKLKIVKRKK